jgi:alanine racemase
MRATRAIIHLDNLKENLLGIRRAAGLDRGVILPVKADAYGHGALEVSRAALDSGCTHLAVASAGEGRALREGGIDAPILLLSLAVPEEYPAIAELGIEPILCDAASVADFARAARAAGKRATVHIKVDTGMGRIGCGTAEAAPLCAAVGRERSLALGGIFTHFPSADSEEADDIAFTRAQISSFRSLVDGLRSSGIDIAFSSAANSGAILLHPDGLFDLVRPGILAYGYLPGKIASPRVAVRPVMEFATRVVFMKELPAGRPVSYGRTWTASRRTWIATVPAGYADGYPRSLSNRASAWAGGERLPVVGRVCMDQLMLDLGPEPRLALHDDVILFGPGGESGSGPPGADELAEIAGTIPYEITCGINKRVPRVYMDGEGGA